MEISKAMSCKKFLNRKLQNINVVFSYHYNYSLDTIYVITIATCRTKFKLLEHAYCIDVIKGKMSVCFPRANTTVELAKTYKDWHTMIMNKCHMAIFV